MMDFIGCTNPEMMRRCNYPEKSGSAACANATTGINGNKPELVINTPRKNKTGCVKLDCGGFGGFGEEGESSAVGFVEVLIGEDFGDRTGGDDAHVQEHRVVEVGGDGL